MAKDLFKFCGTMITTDNFKSIADYQPAWATGTVSVDISNGVKIKFTDFHCFTAEVVLDFTDVEATIELAGENVFEMDDIDSKSYALAAINTLDANLTITGPSTSSLTIQKGNVNIRYNQLVSVHAYPSKLTVTGGCALNINKGEGTPIYELTLKGGGSELEVSDGSTLDIEGNTGLGSTISGFKKVKLDGCQVYCPASASYDDFKYGYDLYGETVSSRMIIGPEGENSYFSFCDILVNDVNYTKVPEMAKDYIKEGTVEITVNGDVVSCDLTNAKIDCSSAAEPTAFKMMYNYGVNINLHGANSIKTGDWAIYNAFGNNSVLYGEYNNGFASLNIEHGYIYVNRAPFTINNCDLTVAGDGTNTIVGSKDAADVLHIWGGKVTLKAADQGTIMNFAYLDTKYGQFTTPSDATYDTAKMQLMSQGAIVKTDVVFEGNNTAVEQISKEENNLQKVMIDGQVYIIRDNNAYNVLGQQVNY